jgi:hypothetical protein
MLGADAQTHHPHLPQHLAHGRRDRPPASEAPYCPAAGQLREPESSGKCRSPHGAQRNAGPAAPMTLFAPDYACAPSGLHDRAAALRRTANGAATNLADR